MVWVFRILAALNGLMLLAMFLYSGGGEDPAGTSMRMGLAVVFLIMLASVIALYLMVKWKPVRVLMLVLLTLPILFVFYGAGLMLG